jgi:short subunit dehydrogenase-like uncharacterized protein
MWMLYGANGYTGRLIAAEATARGQRPILAGRNADQIQSLAGELKCPARVFSLEAAPDLGQHLRGVQAVLHCAGPFSDTARPMVEACLAQGVHYLDITGEIEVIEWASRQHEQAVSAGCCVLPAVGMDVVPSDCLAARLAESLPQATHLELAFAGALTISPGTARTIWNHAGRGGLVRQGGQITPVPLAWKTTQAHFPGGPRWAMTIPWGDVSSAYHTTGIPNIEVYAAVPRRRIQTLRRLRCFAPLANLAPIRALGRWWIDRHVTGPDHNELTRGRTEFWGRVSNAAGEAAEATLETPNGYALTVQTALAILEHVIAGRVPAGFSTPAKALGSRFIEQIPDVTFGWREATEGRPTDNLPDSRLSE